MTYLQFHLIFTLPVLVLLHLVGVPGGGAGVPDGVAVGTVLALVMVFTTPWDNYAAAHGIWGFPDGRYLFRVGWLPIEEYAFFVIQSVLVMQVCALAVGWLPARESLADVTLSDPLALTAAGVFLLTWTVAGVAMRTVPRHVRALHYAWHLFCWFVPILLVQWILAWPILAPRWDILLVATLVPGAYLSWADWMAIRRGIWHFDRAQTTGRNILPGMPWEEAAFFFLTSLLVAQSYLLLVPEAAR